MGMLQIQLYLPDFGRNGVLTQHNLKLLKRIKDKFLVLFLVLDVWLLNWRLNIADEEIYAKAEEAATDYLAQFDDAAEEEEEDWDEEEEQQDEEEDEQDEDQGTQVVNYELSGFEDVS